MLITVQEATSRKGRPMDYLTRLKAVYRKYAGVEVVSGLNPYHFGNNRDASFTHYFRNGESLTQHLGISLWEVMALERICHALLPRSIFIIGNGMGWSAIALAMMNPEAFVVAIEPQIGIELTNRIAFGERLACRVIQGSSPVDNAKVIQNYCNGTPDLVLIDGLHTSEQIILDFKETLSLTGRTATYLFHDIVNFNLFHGLSRIREIAHQQAMRTSLMLGTPSGMVAVTRDDAPEALRAAIDLFVVGAEEVSAIGRASNIKVPEEWLEYDTKLISAKYSSGDQCLIVLSCDDNYIPLARGLVLSLNDIGYPSDRVGLCLLSIDCERASIEWMEGHGVRVIHFDPSVLPGPLASVVGGQQYAQVLRPWLPELLTNTDHFIWLDSDTWAQTNEAIKYMDSWLLVNPDRILLSLSDSHYNLALYTGIQGIVEMQRGWFRECYEDQNFVSAMANRLAFSSGVFAMSRTSPIWELWRHEITDLYPRVAKRASRQHLTEQTAINAVVARSGLFTVMDPVYNFHANGGGVHRESKTGVVETSIVVPPRPISIIHLAVWPQLKKVYAEAGLLYQGGQYLTDREWTRILPTVDREKCIMNWRSIANQE